MSLLESEVLGMQKKLHKVRISLADQDGGNTNVIESMTETIPRKWFNKLFNGKRKVLIIAPSESVTGIEIFEKKGGLESARTNNAQ